MQTTLKPEEVEDPPFKQISDDAVQVLIQFLAVRGHGKSSSLRTLLKRIQNERSDVVFKIFDVSQAWFHNAPVPYRQMITEQVIKSKQWTNAENCVYEIGQLTEDWRRVFVASIIAQDYGYRYEEKKNNAGKMGDLPWVVYVFEEANVYFGSFSFNKNDKISPILKDFVSVGRNYKLSAFLVTTAEVGELSPKLRRRCSRLYGRIESDSDLARLKRKDKETANVVRTLPRFHFVYVSGNISKPFRIRDEVNHVPRDITKPEEPKKKHITLSYWQQIGLGFLISIIIYLFNRFFFGNRT